MQIGVGTPFADSLSVSQSDAYAFGNGGNDNITFGTNVVSAFLDPVAMIDGGAGRDTLVLTGPKDNWSWQQSNSQETNLYFENSLVAELFNIERINVGGTSFNLASNPLLVQAVASFGAELQAIVLSKHCTSR